MKQPIVTASKDVMGGTPVFAGTRVPIQTLIDYLKAGETINDFLEGFPTVMQEQITAFLEKKPGAKWKKRRLTRKVANGDKHPRFAAQRESLGDWQINAPTLKASNKSHINVARFQRAIASFIQIQRFSLSYNVCHL